MSQPDLFRSPREPWNAGRMTGADAPLKPKHIWAIRQHLKSVGLIRDLAMFYIALDAKLRGCDLVKLRLGDIAQDGVIRSDRRSSSKRLVGRCRSGSRRPREKLWLTGWSAEGDGVTTGRSPTPAEMEST